MWPLLSTQGFSMIWPRDLVFDPRWPIHNPKPDFIKTHILTKFHKDLMKNVTSIVYTRFSFYLTPWPSFWPQIIPTQISSRHTFWPNFIKIGWKVWPLSSTQRNCWRVRTDARRTSHDHKSSPCHFVTGELTRAVRGDSTLDYMYAW